MPALMEYEKAKKRAMKKKEKGLDLKKSEELALSGKWWYSFALSEEAIKTVIETTDGGSITPSMFVEMLIYKWSEEKKK